MLKVLDLFSGIGGFSLGLERTGGFETVAFCEQDKFCQAVLRKHWPDVPIFDDVRELTGDAVGSVDVITGGYPCQPFSLAGKRGGAEDDRHVWPEMHRLLDELRPAWVIGENVFGHVSMGLDQVLSDLETSDYACRTFIIPAVAVDAPHRRDRIWIVAHDDRRCVGRDSEEPFCTRRVADQPSISDVADAASSRRGEGQPGQSGKIRDQTRGPESKRRGRAVSDADQFHDDDGRSGAGQICRQRSETANICDNQHAVPNAGHGVVAQRARPAGCVEEQKTPVGQFTGGGTRWLPEPDVGRVAHGIPKRVDRLKGLGNAVVPQIPEIIGNAILEAEALK